MTKMPPATFAELQRQLLIRERQLRQYREAKPRSRFAYASHITKTEGKINFIKNNLSGEDLAKWRECLALDGTVSD